MTKFNLRNIRARLTLWYVAVLCSILIVYIAAVFFFQYAQLQRQMYHDEVQDMETVEGLLSFDAQGGLQLRQDYFARPQNRLLIDRFMEVRDESGTVLYSSSTLKGHSLGGPPFPSEGTDSFNERSDKLQDGSRVFLISHVHPLNGRPLLIRLGYSMAGVINQMKKFLLILILALPVALIAAAFAGYAIARRALQPLEAMAGRAAQITSSNLSERLIIDNEDDELGHMATVLNNLLERLDRAFEQLQRFTADAAHELRTPLAAIRATGEVAIERAQDESGLREAVSSMLEETGRLNQTIDGLLILAKTESQQTGETDELLRIPEVVGEILSLLEVLVEERRVTVIEENDGSERLPVRAERSFLRLALLNVLHNALKFSPPGSAIVISYSNTVQNARRFESVCIHDGGPGITPGEYDLVWNRFFTSRNRDTSAKSGSGLGLSIAKLAVEQSHGTIHFDDTAVKGARCCIKVPCASISTNGAISRPPQAT